MKFKGILQRIFLCLCLCLLFIGMQTYAEETVGDIDEGTATETNRKTEDSLMRDDLSEVTNGSYGYQMEYGVENWKIGVFINSHIRSMTGIPKVEISGCMQEKIFI